MFRFSVNRIFGLRGGGSNVWVRERAWGNRFCLIFGKIAVTVYCDNTIDRAEVVDKFSCSGHPCLFVLLNVCYCVSQ
jgi:hypothetical protein